MALDRRDTLHQHFIRSVLTLCADASPFNHQHHGSRSQDEVGPQNVVVVEIDEKPDDGTDNGRSCSIRGADDVSIVIIFAVARHLEQIIINDASKDTGRQ